MGPGFNRVETANKQDEYSATYTRRDAHFTQVSAWLRELDSEAAARSNVPTAVRTFTSGILNNTGGMSDAAPAPAIGQNATRMKTSGNISGQQVSGDIVGWSHGRLLVLVAMLMDGDADVTEYARKQQAKIQAIRPAPNIGTPTATEVSPTPTASSGAALQAVLVLAQIAVLNDEVASSLGKAGSILNAYDPTNARWRQRLRDSQLEMKDIVMRAQGLDAPACVAAPYQAWLRALDRFD